MNFNDIKVGDVVAFNSGSHGWNRSTEPRQRFILSTVTKVTYTQFVCGTRRVRKSDGQIIGDRYGNAYPVTQDMLQEHRITAKRIQRWVEAKTIINKLTGYLDQRNLTLEQMEEIAKSVKHIVEGGANANTESL